MEEPLISIIIPVYNVEEYLSRCLDSVIHQTYTNLEIICIDDASSDESKEILQKYQKEDARFRVIFNDKNGGVAAARNKGIAVASGEVISFIDADDRIHIDFFKILMNCRSEKKADVVACKYVKITSNEIIPVMSENYECRGRVLTHNQLLNCSGEDACYKINVWGRIYNSSLIRENKFCEGLKIAEDTAFNMDVLFKKENLVFCAIDEPLYFYYCRVDSSSRNEMQSNMLGSIRDVYLPNMEYYGCRKELMLEYSVRALCAARYLSMFEKQHYCECDILLKKTYRLIRNSSVMPIKKHIVYWLFINIPLSYRYFRIITDPTMIVWERQTKRAINKK